MKSKISFLRAMKICSTPSFGVEVKQSGHVVILRHIKETVKCEQRCFIRLNSSSPMGKFLLIC
jgi:hypothetical protein